MAGAIAFSLLGQAVQRQNSLDYRNRMNRQTAALSVHTENAIESYNKLLHSAAAVVNLQATIDTNVWQRFYRDMHVQSEYPELVGLGYASYVKETDRIDFQDKMRATLGDSFTVNPVQGQNEYVVITYIEPTDEANTRAVGFDLNSETSRHRAIVAARDGARVTLTAPVQLVQDQGTKEHKEYGVLMYFPVYHTRNVPETVVERREQLKGYVYLVLRPRDLVQHYINTAPQFAENINISVRDVATNTMLYSSTDATGKESLLIREDASLYLDGRAWQFAIAGREPYIVRTGGPLLIVGLGLFASIVGAMLTFRTLLSRVRSIERTYEDEIQRSKEELLALASHQLRTPASGVKQYLGLLQGGFVGELTAQQKEVAQKAVDANERQLNIINELLYVSKIDAGQLQLEAHEVDMTQLVASIVDGFTTQAKAKGITIAFPTKRKYYAQVDDRYVRMLIENLVSNAIKYSHADTTVRISLRRVEDNVEISVVDKGVGIASEDQKKVFQKFERIKNELSRSEGGSGLGLFLAYELAKAHGGTIRIKSRAGHGSTFTVVLPVEGEKSEKDTHE